MIKKSLGRRDEMILDIAIDSEFQSTVVKNNQYQAGKPLCVQVLLNLEDEPVCRVFINNTVEGSERLANINAGLFTDEKRIYYDPLTETPARLLLEELTNKKIDLQLMKSGRPNKKLPVIRQNLSLHYSPKDFEYFLGTPLARQIYNKGLIEQKRGLSIKSCNYQKTITFELLEDDSVVGYLKLSLRDTYAYNGKSLDYNAMLVGLDKVEIDYDKSQMELFMLNKPAEFYFYACRDVQIQQALTKEYPLLFQRILVDPIPRLANRKIECRNTIGSNVANIIANVLEAQHPELLETFAIIQGGDHEDSIKKRGKTNLSLCSIEQIVRRDDTSIFGAIVNGGRCKNEQPHRVVAHNCIDIDMSGCYSTALVQMDYPIGLPTVYRQDYDQYKEEPLTLREFLKTNEGELLPNLFTIIVDGELSFAQDLIPSFMTTPTKIRKSVFADEFEENIRKIDGGYSWFRKELVNGIITSSILEVLRKVCSNKELSEFLSLKVKCAYFYPKSKRRSIEDLLLEVKSNPGRIEIKENTVFDTRNRCWSSFSLSEIMEPWRKTRAEWKKQKDERSQAIQELVKTHNNSVYGVLASPYFQIGNTVLANSITANARVGMWMMAKALGCIQSITDGGFFPMGEVRHFEGYKPSMDVLASSSCPDDWLETKNDRRRFISTIEPSNAAIKAHIEQFWKPYNLPFQFDVEIKEHEGKVVQERVAFMNKGDYAGYGFLKKRGYKTIDEQAAPEGLMKAFIGESTALDSLLWEFPQSKLLKVGSYKVDEPAMPGDEIIYQQKGVIRPLNITFDTQDETDRFSNYWRRQAVGLEALATTTDELKAVLEQVAKDPWQIVKRHKLAVKTLIN